MNMELIYEYGSRAGFWRLWRLFTERAVPVTVYGVATALARNPRGGRRDAGGRLGDRQPRPEVDRLPRRRPRRSSARHIDEAIRIHTEVDRRAPARLVPGPRVSSTPSARRGGGRLRSIRRHLCRRPALLGSTGRGGAAAHRPLHARRQRHALRHAAGLQLRRAVLHLSEGQLRHALRRGRARRAEDDVGRPALPAGRPARAARPRSRASSTTSQATTRSGWRAASTSPGTGRNTTRPEPREAPP